MGQKADQIAVLVRDLSSAVTIVGTGDLAEIRHMQSILDQVRTDLSQWPGANPEFIKEALSVTLSADAALTAIISSHADDAADTLAAATKNITDLQKLIDSACSPVPATPATEAPADQPQPAGAAPPTVISPDDAPLVADFITESSEHIESAEGGLLRLEANPDDSEAVNLIFRAFHTVKGMAGFLNLKEIGSLAHSAESLLDRARKGTLKLQGASMDLVFASIDALKKMLAKLKECLDSGAPLAASTSLPQLLEQLAAATQSSGAASPVKAPSPTPAPAANADAPAINAGNEPSGVQPAAAETAPTEAKNAVHAAAHTDDKIKVGVAKLDNLVNMIGELVIAQSMVAQQVRNALACEHDLCRKVGHQGKIIRELQELSMSLRMVPIQGLFQKMTRLVRDLSHKAGKTITFTTTGEETEIDRNIVDMIADPLVHMIRNAVDHGIEPADVRTKAGKNPAGTIELSAFHQGGNIVVQISDDGKGLDKNKILKKAIDTGLVESGQDLTDQDIFKLIFHAGLSTAEKVTEISGRGVGMDVVRKNIEALRGKIEIESTVGSGSRFTIRLPLTLAIIDGQLVRVGSQCYIIPIVSIEHSIRPTAEQISTLQGRGEMVNVHGRLLPLMRLYEKFDVTPRSTDPLASSLVIVEGDGKKFCIMVDELLAQQQVVIKSLGEGIGVVKGISGAAILGDGTISLILDIAGLMQSAWKK